MIDQNLETIRQRHFHICQEFDPQRLVNRAIETGDFNDQAEVHVTLDALLQWLSLPSYCDANGHPIVMMTSPVARLYECFKTDARHYQSFCDRYFGHTLHQIPVTLPVQHKEIQAQKWVESTINTLNGAFAAELSTMLVDWAYLKRSTDIAFVGIFNDQLFRHQLLVNDQMMRNWGARQSRK